jgi:hypothetical protein
LIISPRNLFKNSLFFFTNIIIIHAPGNKLERFFFTNYFC